MKMDCPSPCNHVRLPNCDYPKLPKQLDEIQPSNEFPLFRHRWNSNEEVAAILTAFNKHKEWMSLEVKIRPPSGSMILYSRKKVRYKKDGYCWKKRKGGKNIREDHMKLKVQGLECIYGSYVHSDILPTFHRRCYWLLQNPDIVLIHYLNVPYPDDGKVKIPMMPCSVEKKEWTKEELVEQLRPMFSAGSSDQMLEETVEKLVKHLIQYHEGQDKIKGQTAGYKKISCHSKPADGASATRGLSTDSVSVTEDSQCKDIIMNTVCQLNAKSQQSFPQGHPSVVHIQPKSSQPVSCSNSMTQAPFLLSVSQLPTTSYLLLSGGASNSISSVNVTSGCQQQPIPHVLDQPIHHMSHPIHVPQEMSGQLPLFAHHDETDSHPHKGHMVYSTSHDYMSSSSGQEKTDTSHVPHLQNVSADDIQEIIQSSYPVNGQDNFSDFSNVLNENPNPAISMNSSDYNILDNLDFEISDIEKLYNDLSSQPDSVIDRQKGRSPIQKSETCDQELTNEINLFNSDLVQSCQGQQEPNFHDISSICDKKTFDKNLREQKPLEQKILDYSPEWSQSQGGDKILVVGPWCSLSSHYLCLFDGKPTQTSLIQPGVLRCYSPAHPVGVASVQVSCDGHVISNSVPFKYVEYSSRDKNWFSLCDDELKLLLLQRLSIIQDKLKKTSSLCRQSLHKLKDERQKEHFENKVVCLVKSLVSKPWGNMSEFPKQGQYNMTLLHIAAALGYQALVHSLIVWRTDNPSWILDCEIDSHAVDDESCTPLVWACAKGHSSTVQFLYHWNPDSIHILTRDQLSPVQVAQKFGHFRVVNELSSLAGKNNNVSSPPKNTESLSDGIDDNSVFKSPNSVLGSLHIDIPGQYGHSLKSNISSRQQVKHSNQKGQCHRKLAKHFSIDCTPDDFSFHPPSQYERPVRETNSEPRLCTVSNALTSAKNPMLYNPGRDLTSPDILINPEDDHHKVAMDHTQTPSVHVTSTSCIEMDTDADDIMSDDDFSSDPGSPFIDVERVSSEEEDHVTRIRTDRLSISGDNSEDAKRQMVTLAQQIIAAMPMRIKLSPSRVDDAAEFAARERSSSYSSIPSQPSPHASSYEEDSGISTPMGDGFAFDEYRYSDLGTPASSLNSPESTCMPSPYSPYDFKLDSPPPTTEEFTEYFNAPATFMEKDFSLLTLSDQEQRKLYEAAKIIQKTYRKFRNKQQQKEMEAAILIQKYYRRYKQYAYYKKMTQAAVLIQSQFRSYYAQKRFKKSRDAAVVIQNQYRTYKEHERLKKGGNKSVIIQQRYRSHYQRLPKHVGNNTEGQIVQIVPEGVDSTQTDQSSSPDNISQLADDSKAAPPSDELSRETTDY